MNRLPIAVYGATGHTGRFVLAELKSRGWPAVAIGRDAAGLRRLGESGAAADIRAASIDDPLALRAALEGCAAVINCAGPFLDTATAVIEAALHARIHYLDVTAEQAAAQSALDDHREAAIARGVSIVPAAAFFGGLGDLLASATIGDGGAVDEVHLAMALDSWHPTAGTRATGARNTVPRRVIRGGQLVPFEAGGGTPTWAFAAPFGRQEVAEVPLTEAPLLAHHRRVGELRSWLNTRSLADLRDPATPPPAAATPDRRSAQRFRMECAARRGTSVRRAAVSGIDIYASSAPLVVSLAQAVVSQARAGTFAPAQVVDARAFLRSLSPGTFQFELERP
jgi:hypothetical protein